MHTVYILKDLVDKRTLDALRSECDVHFQRLATTIDAEQERSCSIDLFEDARLCSEHKARTNADEYLSKRWREVRPSTQAYCECIRRFLFHSAPRCLKTLLPDIYPNDVYLFNENYIVKSGNSSLEFRWHTDEEEQFKCQMMLMQQDHTDAKTMNNNVCKEYYSLWVPLDDCDQDNGTLVFQGGTKVVPMQLDPQGFDNNTIGVNDSNNVDHDNLNCSSKDSGNDDDEEEKKGVTDVVTLQSSSSMHTAVFSDNKDLTLEVEAGSGVLFSSRLLHRSGPNTTMKMRRVLYAQYTGEVITGYFPEDRTLVGESISGKRKFASLAEKTEASQVDHMESNEKNTPLSFAVKCMV